MGHSEDAESMGTVSDALPLESNVDLQSVTTRAPVIAARIARTRALAPLLLGFVVAMTGFMVAVPAIHGWDEGQFAAVTAMVLITVFLVWVMWLLRRPGPNWDRTLGLAAILFVLPLTGVVVLYEGMFTVAPIAYVAVIHISGQSDNRWLSWGIFSMLMVIYLTLCALVISGVVDGGLANFALTPDLTWPMQLLLAAFVVFSFAGTFRFARLSRGSALLAMAQLDEAHQRIRRRDDQLAEARNALQEVVGDRGHLSGREVGPFLLGDVLGRGGMGEVYRAEHIEGGGAAALKVIHPSLLDPSHLKRFLREAEVTAKLESPHVVKVLASGRTDDGIPYLAMELLEGHDLAWHLRRGKLRSRRRISNMITATATALAVAHEAGVIHRDLKPSNLFLTDDDRWKVLDFGVSKLRAGKGTITGGAIVGTPGYMAPEQATSKDVDHRADVFALGAIAYRALTGRRPFAGDDPMAILFAAIDRQPLRPSSLTELHRDVDSVLAVALAKSPQDRFDTAEELAEALDLALAGSLGVSVRARAAAILRKHPWGVETTGHNEERTRADGPS